MSASPATPARRPLGAAVLLALAATAPSVAADDVPLPALLVLAQRDFYEPDYAPLRASLEAAGLPVRVAAPSLAPAIPHGGDASRAVTPDVALADAQADDYSSLVFVGGWGAASFGPRFPGTYSNADYRPGPASGEAAEALVADFLAQEKRVAGLCFGVAALAWMRVDGASPLAGREVAAYSGGGPGLTLAGDDYANGAVSTRWHVESNGAFMHASGAVGEPGTSADDVVVDGLIVTAEDAHAAPELGRTIARLVLADLARRPQLPQPAGRRALMVIANQDFWHREYAEPRAALEARGIGVDVAAGTLATCLPHADSGYTDGVGAVEPDLTVADALAGFRDDPSRWSAIIFVGGWGASSYQYAYGGTYEAAAYNGSEALHADVNALVEAFTAEGKWVTALCHGVSVLAWARVNGTSPLDGRTVVAWPWMAPVELAADGSAFQRTTREHVESNGATMLPTHSVGDPDDAHDDVVVDGRIITGESFDASTRFGEVVAERILAD